MTRLLLLGLLMCSLMTTPAHALLITIEPDSYVAGTNITNLFNGLTINSYSHTLTSTAPPTYGDVHVTNSVYRNLTPSTGTQHLGAFTNVYDAARCWSTGVCSSPSMDSFHSLLLQFSSPTNFFDVASFWQSDPAGIYAYDSNNQLVGSCLSFGTYCSGAARITYYSYGSGSSYSTLQLGSLDGERRIRTVLIGGIIGNSAAALDTMRYSSVPEPSSLLLLLSGGILLLFVRRIDTRDTSGSAGIVRAPVASR